VLETTVYEIKFYFSISIFSVGLKIEDWYRAEKYYDTTKKAIQNPISVKIFLKLDVFVVHPHMPNAKVEM
jgi:hypothetical protein